MIDLDELEKLANAATPGPWHFHQDDGTALDISEVCIPRPEEDVDLSIASLLEDRDGAFIAAANPQAVLELIELVRKAERAHRTVAKLYGKVTAERDAALARVAELEAEKAETLNFIQHKAKVNARWRRLASKTIADAEARIAEAAKHTAAVLDRLDEMNNGQISYEVYSELHDLVTLGLDEGENEDE